MISSWGTTMLCASLWFFRAWPITPYLVALNSFTKLWWGPIMKYVEPPNNGTTLLSCSWSWSKTLPPCSPYLASWHCTQNRIADTRMPKLPRGSTPGLGVLYVHKKTACMILSNLEGLRNFLGWLAGCIPSYQSKCEAAISIFLDSYKI